MTKSTGQRRGTAGERYPIHEAERLLGWPTAAYMADLLGITPVTLKEWRRRGLSHAQADHVAVTACNLHPVLVWPSWIDNARHDGGPAACPREARPDGVVHHSMAEARAA